MSDMKNETMSLNAEQENQKEQTRVMPPVEAPSRPPRRRRSERYEDEEPVAAQPEATAKEEAAPAGEPAAPRPQTRVLPTQDAASRPMPPRPNVLARAEQMSAQTQDGMATRRPMGTPPGFTPRNPINLEQNDQVRGPLVQRTGSGTGPRIPSSTAGTSARRPSQGRDSHGRGKRKGHGLLIGLVIALLLIGLAVVGVMLLGQNDDGPIGQVRNAVSGLLPGSEEKEPVSTVTASGFTAANNRGTAPLAVMFNLTTSKSVEQVRLVDEDGNPLGAASDAVTENADSIIWVMNLMVEDGFEGIVRAEMYDGANWVDTGMSQTLEIAMPAPVATFDVAAFNEATDEPTEEPTDVPTEAPTEVPTEEPAPEFEPEPVEEPEPIAALVAEPEVMTEAPVEEPTEALTAEPVEEPESVEAEPVEDIPEPAEAAAEPAVEETFDAAQEEAWDGVMPEKAPEDERERPAEPDEYTE